MGTITISLSDAVEKTLRRLAQELYGGGRGSLSAVVEEAIRVYDELLKTRRRSEEVVYRAFKGERLVAEARSLEELAESLRKRNIDFRGLRVISSRGVRSVIRGGYRLR